MCVYARIGGRGENHGSKPRVEGANGPRNLILRIILGRFIDQSAETVSIVFQMAELTLVCNVCGKMHVVRWVGPTSSRGGDQNF